MNNYQVLGRLTKPPELKYTQGGKAICHFSIAVTRNKDESDFFECEAWEKTGEAISNFIKKGQRILIDGRLQQDRWKDQQTQENRSKVKIVVNRFDFIEPANQDNGGQQGQQTQTPPPQNTAPAQGNPQYPPGSMPPPPSYAGQPPAHPPQTPPGAGGASQFGHQVNINTDDIPF